MKRLLFYLLTLLIQSCAFRMPFFLEKNNVFHHRGQIQTLSEGNNSSWNPCNGFYKSVCFKWKKLNKKPIYEPVWNQYLVLNYKIYSRIQTILNDGSVENAATFYKGCLDSGHDKKYMGLFRNLIEKSGGWSDYLSDDYSYIQHIIEVTKLFNIHPLIKFSVDVDFTNRSKHSLYIGSGDLIYPDIFLIDHKKYPSELKVYKTWILNTLKYIFPDKHFEDDIDKLLNFEISLALLNKQLEKKEKISISNLPNETDWFEHLNFLLEDSNVSIYTIQDSIIVYSNYIRELAKLIQGTELHIVSKYISWSLIKDLSRDISSVLRHINFQVDRSILGVEEDLPREIECVQNVLKYFAKDLIQPYVEKHFNTKTKSHVKHMVFNIKKQFVKMLEKNNWMNLKSKTTAIDKIKSARCEIGLPGHYNQSISEYDKLTNNYFMSLIKLRNVKYRKQLEELNKNVKDIKWPMHVFDVNAYYSVLQNTIILPLGILSKPFYDPSQPNTSNYGALGSLIGHELSHALDIQSGLLQNILSDELDIREYSNRIDCFKKQYDSYGVDGGSTLSENIADNIGLKLSYNAMLEEFYRDRRLPDANERAAFFTSYTKMWCETMGEEDLLMQEEHAPVDVRVTGAFDNFKPFKYTYNCNNGNSTTDCHLW